MRRVLILAFVCLLAFSNSALALNVGVAPSVVDLGEVRPGSQVSGTFYIASDASNEFVVDLGSMAAPSDFYNPSRTRKYTFDTSHASEEDVSSWATFLDNSVTVPTEKYFVPEINSKVNRKIDFVVNIPADAEPGYHAGQLIPSPKVSTESTEGVGVGIITIVKATYIFTVSGEATRGAEIVGFDYNRLDEKYEEVSVLVKNTGTVTESIRLESLEIDEGGKKTNIGGTGYRKVPPNQITELKARFDATEKELGSYKVSAGVSWMTGETEKDGVIEVLAFTEPSITGGVVGPAAPIAQFPIWIVPTFIIFFAIVIYWWHNGKD